MVDSVMPVCDVVCQAKHQGNLQRSPQEPVLAFTSSKIIYAVKTFYNLHLTEVVVEGGVAAVHDPGGEGGGQGGAQGDGEPAHEDLVNLLLG